MKRTLSIGLVLVALMAQQGWAADLQSHVLNGEQALGGSHFVTTNKSIALRVACTNAVMVGAGATVAVDSSGNLSFTKDGTNADTTIQVGSTAGTITVSNTAANTFGLVAATINASGNWQAILVDVLPQWSAAGTLNTMSATAPTLLANQPTPTGDAVSLYVKTSAAGYLSACIGPEWLPSAAKPIPNGILQNQRSSPYDASVQPYTNALIYTLAEGTYTSATATSILAVYSVNKDAATETGQLMWSQAGAGSTSNATLDLTAIEGIWPGIWAYNTDTAAALISPDGWRLIVVYYAGSGLGMANQTGGMSAGNLQVHGLTYHE